MALDFKRASLVEGVRFTAQVAVPNVVQGLFRKREAVASTVAKVPADNLAYRLTAGLAKKYGPDPFWVRVVTDDALLLTHPDDIRIVLGGSPSPFAADPDAKKKGMAAFQPSALTTSRGDLWADRRAFAEAVLQTGKPMHKLAKVFAAVAVEEADALLATGAPLDWASLNAAFNRLTRRVVLGEDAADDTELTAALAELMDAGNKMPGAPAPGYDAFHARLTAYLEAPDRHSLSGLVAAAPQSSETDPAGQLIHWLFAMGDTLPANIFRTIAVLSTHPLELAEVRAEFGGFVGTKGAVDPKVAAKAAYTGGALCEAMRLWPTTSLFGRVTTEDFRWPNGQLTPAGTQVLIHNLFNHRNRDRVEFADRFAPGEWVSGSASSDWSFNFFSHGPQGCPGAGMSLFLGQAFLGRLLADATPKIVEGPRPAYGKPLPYALDIYSLKIALG